MYLTRNWATFLKMTPAWLTQLHYFFFFCDLKIVKKDFKIRPEIIFLHVQSGYVRNPCLQKKDSGFGYCPGKNPLQLFYYDISLIFVQQMLAQSNLNILLWNFMKRN